MRKEGWSAVENLVITFIGTAIAGHFVGMKTAGIVLGIQALTSICWLAIGEFRSAATK